ncbi:MAG: UbiA prenyltransferase family protein [Planctomycetota bacterium]
MPDAPADPSSETTSGAPSPIAIALGLVRLARPKQWLKGAFVFIGPTYALADGFDIPYLDVIATFVAFGLAASGCYVVNDLADRELDRTHPRKKKRPIASGLVAPGLATIYAAALFVASLLTLLLVGADQRLATGATVVIYTVNVLLYSAGLKRLAILDVLLLSLGFVLRTLGGCAAAGVEPSTWLLNVTLFVAMFLAFGKRLGERRTMAAAGAEASSARKVQLAYSDELLRMAVVVTAVATLITYAGYVQTREDGYTHGFNLLWLTMLPATYGLFRAMTLLERGDYDDPTVLATKDIPFQLSSGLFVAMTLTLALLRTAGFFTETGGA